MQSAKAEARCCNAVLPRGAAARALPRPTQPDPLRVAAGRRDGLVSLAEYLTEIADEDEVSDLSMENVGEEADFEDWLGTIKARRAVPRRAALHALAGCQTAAPAALPASCSAGPLRGLGWVLWARERRSIPCAGGIQAL